MKKISIDSFVLAIFGVVILAYFFPQLYTFLPLDTIGSVGIALIFFFYGLKLSPDKLKVGLANWKLHLLVQSSTFLLFPILILCFRPLIASEHGEAIWLAFFFLAALPSTVSSSVVMVSMAKGNLPSAIFNASISGLLGVVLTPLWMGLFLQQTTDDFSLSSIYLKLLVEIVVPICCGLFLQRFWGKYAVEHAKKLALFDKSIILIIIYKSFVTSFEEDVFTSVDWKDLLLILLGVIALFYLVYGCTGFMSKKLGFSREDQITAQYCGTKKSLVHGTVFSKVLFPASFPVGMVLLPLMLFHAFQILVVSIYASKRARE